MNVLLIATWLCLPLAPLNPIDEDTLASINAHVTVGMASPNGIVSTGPEVSAKYEMLVIHPFVLRGEVDGKYGRVTSNLFPQGDLYTLTLALDALYYRGTDHLTGYIGVGAVYAFNHFHSHTDTADSLRTYENVTAVDVEQQLGYRLTLGIRYHRSYSLEIGITELRPDFIKQHVEDNGVISRTRHATRTGGFRITLGYVFPLKRY